MSDLPPMRIDDARLAVTPAPPYTAVIFTSLRTEGDNGYGVMVTAMEALARQQPGYLGMESARQELGITGVVLGRRRGC